MVKSPTGGKGGRNSCEGQTDTASALDGIHHTLEDGTRPWIREAVATSSSDTVGSSADGAATNDLCLPQNNDDGAVVPPISLDAEAAAPGPLHSASGEA